MIPWQKIFSEKKTQETSVNAACLGDLRDFLDTAHIRSCLVKPFQEYPSYPLVEARELLPSFDSDMYEYPDLPGFALVALGRPMDYFSETFQYDKLHPEHEESPTACTLQYLVREQNIQTLVERLPRCLQDGLREAASGIDATSLSNYSRILPFLLKMDRAHVFSLNSQNLFHLAGIFASFPSDIDSELKRYGLRMGKFAHGDSAMYERNRMFVYQYLMELYGFPVVSERRTSSALFARKLHRMGESFLLRVMGQSDRTLTTYMYEGENSRYPRLDKTALVAIESDQKDAIRLLKDKGFFLDEERRVVIIRITYRQHEYDPSNVRQDRALSVIRQEILHPLNGRPFSGLNIIKDPSNMFLRLNDIVRGEYVGKVLFKRTEIVENTDTDEKRLKFLYSWLAKHQNRMIEFPDELFADVERVIDSYLQAPQKAVVFDALRELFQEVRAKLSYIQQARRARLLEDLGRRTYGGSKIKYLEMSQRVVDLLNELQYEIVNFFPDLVDNIINCGDAILHDSYMVNSYITPPENSLSNDGLEIRKNYRRIVALLDSIKSVRKARLKSVQDKERA